MRSKKYESKVIEGATFSLYDVSLSLRQGTDVKNASLKQKTRVLLNQYTTALYDSQGKRKLAYHLSDDELLKFKKDNDNDNPSNEILTEEDKNSIAYVDVQTELINNEIRMAIAKARLASFSVPDEPNIKTFDDLINEAPEAFAMEIIEASSADWSLADAVRKNFVSPISSPNQEDGANKTTTALSVSDKETTTTGTAS